MKSFSRFKKTKLTQILLYILPFVDSIDLCGNYKAKITLDFNK